MAKNKKKIKKAANVVGFWKQTAKSTKKNVKKLSKAATPVYSRYAAPTVGLFKKTGSLALGTGKLALRAGALGIPGLAATGLYFGAKHAIKKGERVYKRTPFKQFDKKGRWMI